MEEIALKKNVVENLEDLFFEQGKYFTLSATFPNIFPLFILFVNWFAIPAFEPTNRRFIFVIGVRVGGILYFVLLYILLIKCHNRAMLVFIYIAMPLMIFKVNCTFISYGDAYFTFILYYAAIKEIIVINCNLKTIITGETVTLGYHIIRAVILKLTNKAFGIIYFIHYLGAYVFINFALHTNYNRVREIIEECDKLRRDFAIVLHALPLCPHLNFHQLT